MQHLPMTWTGSWDYTAQYAAGDAVTYKASAYVATTAPTKGQVPLINPAWQLIAGPVWLGQYNPVSSYLEGQIVALAGSSYVAMQDVPPNTPPNSNSQYWQLVAQAGQPGPSGVGIRWRGEWSNQTQYTSNDAVSYNNSDYIAVDSPPVGSVPTDTANWQLMTQNAQVQSLGQAILVSILSGASVGLLTLFANTMLTLGNLANLANQVANAANQAANAMTTATSAATQAGSAAQLAGNAMTSAGNAMAAATSAATQAGNAMTTATNATRGVYALNQAAGDSFNEVAQMFEELKATLSQ